KDVWDELKEIYNKQDGYVIFNLHHKIYTLTQSVKEHGQLLRLMQFLVGLDDMYSSVRSLILTMEPLPDVRSAFATLSRDESHRNCGSSSKSVKTGPTAFAVRPSNDNNWNSTKTGHTIDRCFELVGYPRGFIRNNSGQCNSNSATSNDIKTDHSKSAPNTLTNDQYQRLMTLLSDKGFNSKVLDGDW
ncbi:hypothetical protein Tco_0232363, partial [Tanacetum coccineum]